MKAYILLALFLFGLTGLVSAQIEQPLRVEINLESGNGDYTVVPVGENGVILYTISKERLDDRNKVKWFFTGYDTEFRQIWKSAYIIKDVFDIRDSHYSGGNLYLLYGRMHRDQFTMATVNARTGEIRSKNGAVPRRMTISTFKVYKGIAYINGMIRKRPHLILFNLQTGENKEFPLKFEGTGSFESIDIDEINNQVNIVYTVTKGKEKFLNIKSFRGSQLVDDLLIHPEGDDNLLTGKLSTVSSREKIIVGTYAVKETSAANGLYFARVINDDKFIINYYNFTHFNRFFDFLPDREKERILKKRAKQENKGKELNLGFQLLVHDLIRQKDQYILIAEAYYPTYRTEPYTYTTVINGVPIIQTRYITVFDGYLYTHAIIAGFNEEGIMLWDNSFEMGDFKSFSLEPRVNVSIKPDGIVLAYGTYNEIKTKVIRGTRVLDGKNDVPIKTGNVNDVVRKPELSHINQWYGEYFLVWGYQTIKNQQSDDRKRTVFFFNKVRVN